MKIKKRILSALLALSMVATAAVSSVSAAVVKKDSAVSADYGLTEEIQDGNILHCFDWKYNDIKAELKNIAEAGFTAVQTSPVQPHDTTGTWYWAYLPLGFYVGSNEFGTKADLQALCTEADKYGIKVVVDVVANHLSGDHSKIQNDLKDGQYWHTYGTVSNWGDRYQVINGEIGMPDLNTGHSYVQSAVAKYVKELKSIGVDGIRWDAAKHIGLPSEGDNFWKMVTLEGLFNYGEILVGPADGDGHDHLMKEYTNYISVTDSVYGSTLRDSFKNGQAPSAYGNWAARGIASDRLVLWAESHDTWSNGYDWGYSHGHSQNVIDRAYAVAASRAGASALYFSRPTTSDKESIKMGMKGSTHFTSKEVAEVNKFRNAMNGQKEYYTTGSNCAVVCREQGAVVVAGSGSNMNVSVPNGGSTVKPGTYVDQISGNTWTVTSSTISGKIGSSGIAAIYNPQPVGPSASVTPGSKNYTTDTLTLTLKYSNATSGQYSVDGGAYTSFTNGQTITIGSGAAYGTKTTVSVKASDASTTSDVETYTYTKVDPTLTQKIYFDNSSYKWSNVYAYIYDETSGDSIGVWPGQAMTVDSATGYYVVEVPENLANGLAIFTESETATTNRYPADMQPGLELGGKTMLFSAGNSWKEYTPVTPSTTVPVTTQPTTTPVTQPTTEPVEGYIIGDVNSNGYVSISDATEIQMHLAGYKTLADENLKAADVNLDGTVDVKDATAIQLYLVNLPGSDNHCGEIVGDIDPTQPVTQPTTPVTDPTDPTVTQPVTQPSGNYVYYKNTNNWSGVNAYYWSESNTNMVTWPGTAMTNVGNNVYRIELPADAQYIIFSNNGANQTGDIKLEGFGKIYNNGWTNYNPDPTDPTIPSGDGTTVTFTNSLGWGGTIYCYYWQAGSEGPVAWPGTAMTSAGTNDYGQAMYTFNVPAGNNCVIFTNGSSQTVDITLDGSVTKFYAKSEMSGSGHQVGTW